MKSKIKKASSEFISSFNSFAGTQLQKVFEPIFWIQHSFFGTNPHFPDSKPIKSISIHQKYCMAWKIKQTVITAITSTAKATYPNEFIALLGGNKKEKTVTELIILPSVFGETHSEIRTDLLPSNSNTLGSVHSHPGYSNHPSREDLAAFARLGELHLIICEPYEPAQIASFDQNGKRIEIKVVP